LTLEPPKAAAFTRKPKEHDTDTTRMLADLEKTATLLEGHLSGSLGLRLLEKNAVYQFFSYLFNLEEWATAYTLTADDGVDRQIVNSPVSWHSDHLTIGRRYVQMFSLKTTPEASRPCLFSGLMALDCDSILLTTWRPKSTTAARSEIDAQEKFISFFKVGVLTRVMSGRDTASIETGAGARAANTQVDDLGEVIRSLDKKAQGEFSLRFLVAARSVDELRGIAPAVHRVFVDARAQVMEETLGNLSAFYAMFPGNTKFNVFPMWLAEDHHARLSSAFAPNLGHPHSEDLDNEYLNIFETRTRTPFFQDVYVDGVRVMLILGPTGTGKSVHGNMAIAHEQKYGGFTYIFDIGGSYESVVELYGGRVDRIGKDGPRVNPFRLEPTESNVTFLYSFVKLLLMNGGAELEPEDDDVIHKAVRDMYLLDRESPSLESLPAEEARPVSLEVGWQRRLCRHLRQHRRQPFALAPAMLRLPGREQRTVRRPDRAVDGVAASPHQRRALQPCQSWRAQAHPHRRDFLFNEEPAIARRRTGFDQDRAQEPGRRHDDRPVRRGSGRERRFNREFLHVFPLPQRCHLQPEAIRGTLQDERAADCALRELAGPRRSLHAPRRVDESDQAQSR
jgi:hypothetical protein